MIEIFDGNLGTTRRKKLEGIVGQMSMKASEGRPRFEDVKETNASRSREPREE